MKHRLTVKIYKTTGTNYLILRMSQFEFGKAEVMEGKRLKIVVGSELERGLEFSIELKSTIERS